jgi:hypothetical protein
MLACIKDWELSDRRLQLSVDNQEIAEALENLYLDVPKDGGSGPTSASTSASAYASIASGPADT